MQFPHILLLAALAGPVATPALAGAQTLDITIANTGSETLRCRAATAHWFSVDMGDVSPGESLSYSFGVDVQTGGVFQLNDRGDHMAVQRIWCGEKGNDWPSRAEIRMERRAGVEPQAVRLNCASDKGKTACVAP